MEETDVEWTGMAIYSFPKNNSWNPLERELMIPTTNKSILMWEEIGEFWGKEWDSKQKIY